MELLENKKMLLMIEQDQLSLKLQLQHLNQ